MKVPSAATLAAVLFAAPALAFAQGAPPTLGDGMTGYWRLDEATGTLAADSSGNGFHGTWGEGITSTAPGNAAIRFGNPACVVLQESGGGVSVPDHEDLNITGDIGISVWVYPTGDVRDWQRLVGKGNATTRTYGIWRYPDGTNRLYFQFSRSDGPQMSLTSSGSLTVDAWNHVACTIMGTEAAIYLNGVKCATGTRSFAAQPCSEPLIFGSGIHGTLQGRLDEVRLYNRSLALAEVTALAQGYTHYQLAEPAGLRQFDPAASAELPLDGTLVGTAIETRATIASPTGRTVRLALEVQPVGTPFSGTPSATGPLVASGSVASVLVAGLAPGQSYHWRVQVVDVDGEKSGWRSHGGNAETEADFRTAVPVTPPSLGEARQVNPVSGGLIRSGEALADSEAVRIEAIVSEPNGATVRLEVEIISSGGSFAGIASASSPLAEGGPATVDIPLAPGRYRWQARAVNQWDVASPWSAAGGDPDLSIIAIGSTGRTFGDTCSQSAGSMSPAAIILFLLAALRRR